MVGDRRENPSRFDLPWFRRSWRFPITLARSVHIGLDITQQRKEPIMSFQDLLELAIEEQDYVIAALAAKAIDGDKGAIDGCLVVIEILCEE